MRLLLSGTHPALDFVRPLLERHYELVDAGGSPDAVVAFGPVVSLPPSVERVILVTDAPAGTPHPATLVIGATPPAAPASHARLTTEHPAELLSLIDGFLRYPDRFPAGGTRVSAPV